MKKAIYIVMLVYAILACLSIIFFDGTGDSGDSINHYLFAKYAPKHMELFFHHWAKPLFVLLAAPFAQFGFIGVKIFNSLNVLLTLYFTYFTAKNLGFKNSIVVSIILIFTPTYFVLGFSGLTEPLFALMLSLSLFFVSRKQFLLACIVLSFITFIRTEGYLFILTFGFYMLLQKKYKMIPFLALGSVLYSFVGYFIFNDLLWVFNNVPYVADSNKYGTGDLFHFVNQLYYIVGVPIFLLFWLGFISIIYRSIKRSIKSEELLLIFISFAGFFIAHSLFWYLGIFDSMGLSRVLISVIPLIALISLQGFNFISEELTFKKNVLRRSIQIVFVLYILIFPFTSNPAAINWEKDLSLSEDQKLAQEVTKYIYDNNLENTRFYYSQPYLSECLNIDPFDNSKHIELRQDNLNKLNKNEIIIWENWFSIVECNISKEYIQKLENVKEIKSFQTTDKGREIKYTIFKVE